MALIGGRFLESTGTRKDDFPLRVMLDLRCVHAGMTGMGRYALNLHLSLANAGREVELGCITTEEGVEIFRSFGNAHLFVAPGRHPGWDDLALPDVLREFQADLFHSPLFVLPGLRTCLQVCTIHDVIPLARPDLSPASFQQFFHSQIRKALRRADHVVTVSRFSREDLLRHLPIEPHRVSAIHEPVSPLFRPQEGPTTQEHLRDLGLEPGYILAVGAIDRRKNLPRLIEAYALLRAGWDAAPPLVLVGEPSGDGLDLAAEIRRRDVERHVRPLGRVPDGALVHLYAGAALLAFPSLYEGFGLPVLEAMATGTPVVTSRSTSLPEIAGDAAILVDPESVSEIKDGMARVLKDPALRQDLSARGVARASEFTLERQASDLIRLYGQLLQVAA